MARANHTETTTDPLGRLRQLGAREMRQHSTDRRRVYFSGNLDQWITLSGGSRGYTLKFYDGCPC